MTMVTYSSVQPGMDRPFDDFIFVNSCSTGQHDQLVAMMEVEKRYQLTSSDCSVYRHELDSAAGTSSSECHSSIQNMNADWRYRIARWLLSASDEFSLSRETAIFALSYFDRFLTKKKRISKHFVQLASVTCLFIASKIFEKRPIKMAAIIKMANGKFDKKDVTSVEQEIVNSVGSYMYPPTAGAFVLILLNGFSGPSSLVNTVIETCQFIIELAACDFFFLPYKQSKIAVAAIIVTIEQHHLQVPSEVAELCLSDIMRIVNFTEDMETIECTRHLRNVYMLNELRIKSLENNTEHAEEAPASSIQSNTDGDIVETCRRATPSPATDEEIACSYLYKSSRIDYAQNIKWTNPKNAHTANEGQRKRRRDEENDS